MKSAGLPHILSTVWLLTACQGAGLQIKASSNGSGEVAASEIPAESVNPSEVPAVPAVPAAPAPQPVNPPAPPVKPEPEAEWIRFAGDSALLTDKVKLQYRLNARAGASLKLYAVQKSGGPCSTVAGSAWISIPVSADLNGEGEISWDTSDTPADEYIICLVVKNGDVDGVLQSENSLTLGTPVTYSVDGAIRAFASVSGQLPLSIMPYYREICHFEVDEAACTAAGLLYLKTELSPYLSALGRDESREETYAGSGVLIARNPGNDQVSVASRSMNDYATNPIQSVQLSGADVDGDSEADDITIFGGGTPANPFLVGTLLQLQALAFHPSVIDRMEMHLTADIDASPTSSWHGGQGFEPIGPFRGVLDGKGYSVTGLRIARLLTTQVALIKHVQPGGIVRNLVVSGAVVNGRDYVGLVAGKNSGTIESVKITGSSIPSEGGNDRNRKGLITGFNDAGATVRRSLIESSDVRATYFGGGVAGQNVGGLIEEVAGINVTINGSRILGGFAGTNASGGIIRNCFMRGTQNGARPDFGGIGGMVGRQLQNSRIINSYVSMVFNSPADPWLGGVIGELVSLPDGHIPAINTFWDTTVSAYNVSAAGSGRTSAELKNAETFSVPALQDPNEKWDFENIWKIDPAGNDGFPVLRRTPG